MKAPDKIYLERILCSDEVYENWHPNQSHKDDVEYIRKGILLEWAKEQLKTMRKNEIIPSIINAKCDIIEDLLDKLDSM